MGIKLIRVGFMMVNFMRQLDWATKWSDVWSNIILCMFVREFLGVINI